MIPCSGFSGTKQEDISDEYHIGSFVVCPKHKSGVDYFEIVDGQQRMITLTLMAKVLQTFNETQSIMNWFKGPNVEYNHREIANEAIRTIGDTEELPNHETVINIWAVYHTIKNNIQRIVENKVLSLVDFTTYLLNNVIIMRIPVPRDTNLNHYFEIMNSRGEQLEKHEVLKANLMDYLNNYPVAMDLFNDIWEACSNMSKYVQMNMSPELRNIVFSNSWAEFQDMNFDCLLSRYTPKSTNHDKKPDEEKADVKKPDEEKADDERPKSISELFMEAENNVKYPLPDEKKEGKESERFGSVVNFPNFLLHVLKITYHCELTHNEDVDNRIKLDDKRLIETFDDVLKTYDDEETKRLFVKKFIIALMKIRHLFDMYVIKREHIGDNERWSLKKLKKYDGSNVNYVVTFSKSIDDEENEDSIGKEIRMLESMFHVSSPTQIYKHWLNAVLYYIYKPDGPITQQNLRDQLYKLACDYMLNRYLCDEKTDFEDIIFNDNCVATESKIDWNLINKGCCVENFVFNFYDYITWEADQKNHKDFEFTYRTSVEHFYPQHPTGGNDSLDASVLNSFGNLCLISRGINSKFSNNMPKAKVANFKNDKDVKDLSIKLEEMIEITDQQGWGKDQIEFFENQAKERIKKALGLP